MPRRVAGIEDFKSTIAGSGGPAKQNLYYVELPARGAVETVRKLSFFCKSVTLPQRGISTINREVGLDFTKVAYGYTNTDISMTFHVMNDQLIRSYFETWQQNIVQRRDDEGGYNVAFPADYMKQIKIYQLKRGESYPAFNRYKDVELGPININLELDIDIRKAGGPTYKWELEDAYPVAFQADTMTNDSRDISEITVEFAYRRWKGTPMSQDQEISIDVGGGADINLGNVITKKIYNAVN